MDAPAVVDGNKVERLLGVLRDAKQPLMIREVAERMSVSLNTASKYVDVCEAAGLVTTKKYATTRQIALNKRGTPLQPR